MAQAKQQSFTDLLEQMNALKDQLNSQAQERVEAIKAELAEISDVTGKSIPELLGLASRVRQADAPSSGSSRGSGGKDPEIESFKADYAGKAVINPGHGNGKDYIVGSRGQFPSWVRENLADIRGGRFDVISIEEYQNRDAPGEVKPE